MFNFVIWWGLIGLVVFSAVVVSENGRPTVFHTITGVVLWPLLLLSWIIIILDRKGLFV